MRRSGRINWTFLIVCFLAVAAVTLTVVGLWYWNKHMRAQRGLRLGTAAYENEQWDKAADYFGQYLAAIRPEQDVEILLKYAEAQLNRRPMKKEFLEQALRSCHQILQIEENEKARKMLIELYLPGDPLEAERHARQYLDKQFDSQIACYAARALMEQHQVSKALEQLQKTIAQYPSCINAYLLLARIAEKNPQLSEKTPWQWLSEAVEANPDNPLAYLYRARYALHNQQPQSAAPDIARTESMESLTREQHLQLASVYLMAGQNDKARQLLHTLQEENADDLLLWNLWGQWALRSGSPEEMARIASEGLASIRPDSYDFISTAVELYIQAGRWEQARQNIQILKDRQERPEVVSYMEGLLAEAQGHWPVAIEAWRKIINSSNSNNTNNIQVHIKLAQALERTGDLTAAIQHLRSLLLQHPEQQQIHSLLARWYADAGRWTEALEHVRQALALRPEDVPLQLLFLEIKTRQARASGSPLVDEEWNKVLKNLQEQNPENPSVQFLQIRAHIRSGQLEQAQTQLDRVEQQLGRSLQSQLLRADLLVAQEQTRQAIRVLEETIQTYPDALEPVQKRVFLYVQNKQFPECLDFLQRVEKQVKSAQTKKTVRLWKTEICVLADRPEMAIEELVELAQEYPRDIPVRRRLLELTRKTESVERLQQWIEEIRELEGRQGRQWRYEQARLLYERGDLSNDYPRIVSILEGILRDYPEDLASRILLASSHEAAGNLRLAITEYQDALARDPENMDLVVSAVGAMYRAEEYRQAENLIAFVSRRGLRDPRLSRLEAQQLLREGKLGSASEILQEMMAQSPEDQDIRLSLALIRLYQNRLEEAEQLIRELLEQDPASLPAIAAKVELALRKNDPQQAMAVCDQAVAQFQKPKLYTLRAMTRIKTGDRQGAEQDIEQMLALTGGDTDSLLLAGDLYLYMGNLKQAVHMAEQALAKSPDDFPVLKKAVLVYARDPQKQQAAEQLLEKSLALQPDDPDLNLLKAQFLLRTNTPASAEKGEKLLAEVVARYPHMETAWAALGEWYLRKDQTGRAMDYVLQGLGYFPDSKSLGLLKAQIESRRSMNLAIPTLESLHERFPEDNRIVAILAESYLRSGQIDRSVEFLEKQIEKGDDPAPVSLQQVYMTALYEQGQTEQARQIYDRLRQDNLDPAGTLRRWADLLIQNQQWSSLETFLKQNGSDQPSLLPIISDLCLGISMGENPAAAETAQKCLLSLIEKYPDHPHLCLSLGRFYHYRQRFELAEQQYRKLLNPDVAADDSMRVIAMNNLAWILAHENGNTQEALQWANQGLKIEPENADLLDTRGEILFMMGDYENAKKDLEKALSLIPSNSSSRVGTGYRLGKTLIQLGENTEALRLFRDVLQWNRNHLVLSAEHLSEIQEFISTNEEKS